MNKDEIEHYSVKNIWGNHSIDLLFREKIQNCRSDIGLTGYSICKDAHVALQYFEIQSIIDQLTNQLLNSGLNSGDILAVQLPNSVETQLLYLACWQQNIIIAALPSLWRKRDIEQALIRISPQAFICSKIHDGFNFDELMYDTAFNIATIRQLYSLGGTPSDGCIALDNCYNVNIKNDLNLLKPTDYAYNDPNVVCFISFAKDDMGVNMPSYHTHNHLIAATRLTLSLYETANNCNLITPFAPTSMTSITTGLLAWTLSNFTLTCEDGIIATEFQNLELKNSILILPKSFDDPILIQALFEQGLNNLVLLQKIQSNTAPNISHPYIIDIISIDEFAFIPIKRDENIGQLSANIFNYTLLDNITKDEIILSIKDEQWQIRCSFLPLYCGNFNKPFTTQISTMVAPSITKTIVGSMSVDFTEIEYALKDYPGIEDVAILNFENKLMLSKPIIAVVPKIGSVILQHELVNFLKDQKIASYKIPDELFKIPEIPRDYNNQIIRTTSREELLKKVGPNYDANSDSLVAVQQELVSLLDNI